MRIPFTKAHGAKNDFLLTWANEAPRGDLRQAAIALCNRYTGIGADGWMLVTPASAEDGDSHGAIRLYNSDGSDSEISGNGTRCAAAFLIDAGLAGNEVRIATGAGIKVLTLKDRNGLSFLFEMNMGRPTLKEGDLHYQLPMEDGIREVTILNVGNPQCAVFVDNFDFDWRSLGKRLEWHPHFPNRTNVSFVRSIDEHSVEVRIWERGAGETMSSGTGSTGAAAAAVLRGLAKSPVQVHTPAGPLPIRWEDDMFLTGPAEIVAGGMYYWETANS